MRRRDKTNVWEAAVGAVLGLVLAAVALARQPAQSDKVAAIQESFQASQAHLMAFEWIETTVVSVEGEEKSRKQERCYYGAEGGIQKVPLGTPEETKTSQELKEYMEHAVALLTLYVPPDPARIQRSKDAGKMSIRLLEPGKRVQLDFGDYVQPGDVMGVEVDVVSNRILNLLRSSPGSGSVPSPLSRSGETVHWIDAKRGFQ